MLVKRSATLAALISTVVLGAGTNVSAAPIVVSPSSMGSWAFDNRDATGTIIGGNPTGVGAMVNGPATPPLGVGSANLATGNGVIGGDGAEELRNTAYAGVSLSSLTALSYSTYMTANNGQQFPYLGLTINFTGGTSVDDIFFFEPPYQTISTGNPALPDQGATVLNTWQTWDALVGGWWDNLGLCTPGTGVNTLSACLGATDFANAVIVNAASGLGGVRFDVGFASPEDQFNGNIDNFTVGINGNNTTFDFEPDAQVPEPGTLALIGMALLSLLGLGLMRRRADV